MVFLDIFDAQSSVLCQYDKDKSREGKGTEGGEVNTGKRRDREGKNEEETREED